MVLPIALLSIGALFIIAGYRGQGLTDLINGEPPPERPKYGSDAEAISATKSALPGLAMESEMERMISLRLPYQWGGGHASFDSNGPWDCSGAVSWLGHYAGWLKTNHPLTSTGFMTQGKSGRGKVFTVYANPTHVFIKMESGPKAGQCWGTTSRIASQGGSLRWHQHTTVGFVARNFD